MLILKIKQGILIYLLGLNIVYDYSFAFALHTTVGVAAWKLPTTDSHRHTHLVLFQQGGKNNLPSWCHQFMVTEHPDNRL